VKRSEQERLPQGSDVFFNRGQYQPGLTTGNWLLGHELGHVVQQNSLKSSMINLNEDKEALVEQIINFLRLYAMGYRRLYFQFKEFDCADLYYKRFIEPYFELAENKYFKYVVSSENVKGKLMEKSMSELIQIRNRMEAYSGYALDPHMFLAENNPPGKETEDPNASVLKDEDILNEIGSEGLETVIEILSVLEKIQSITENPGDILVEELIKAKKEAELFKEPIKKAANKAADKVRSKLKPNQRKALNFIKALPIKQVLKLHETIKEISDFDKEHFIKLFLDHVPLAIYAWNVTNTQKTHKVIVYQNTLYRIQPTKEWFEMGSLTDSISRGEELKSTDKLDFTKQEFKTLDMDVILSVGLRLGKEFKPMSGDKRWQIEYEVMVKSTQAVLKLVGAIFELVAEFVPILKKIMTGINIALDAAAKAESLTTKK
jgi:hypothetical protein